VSVRWRRRLLWIAGFACLWIKAFDDPPLRTEPYVLHVEPDGATLAVITAGATRLECELRAADGSTTTVVRDTAERRRHSFRFEGLTPATTYGYEVTEIGGEALGSGAIRTASVGDAAEVRFAFLGDSGGQPPWIWLQRMPVMHLPARLGVLPVASTVKEVGAAIAAFRPEFVLHLGDVIYPWGHHAHYASGFFRPFAKVLRDAPVYAVLGNHDVMDCDGLQAMANLPLPACEETGDGRCFSFAWGPVRVIGLDCNLDRRGSGPGFLPEHPSARFLARELRSCTEPWVVVATHFPMKSQSDQRDRADLLLGLLPMLEEGDVSLYLSGHDHCYQRFPPAADGNVPLVVSGGGGKSLYEVRPGRTAAAESAFHWCSAVVRGKEFTVEAWRLDGSRLDSLALRLPEGAALQRLQVANPGRAQRIQQLRNR
jgi:tartrate-resistant acid phosphatase type 5